MFDCYVAFFGAEFPDGMPSEKPYVLRYAATSLAVLNEDNFSWLSQWYLAQCDDDWEHSYGVKIDTLDNPGWTLKIDLTDTALDGRAFERVMHGEPSGDLEEWRRTGSWWVASVQGSTFQASCGPLDLSAAIGVFRRWAEQI
jgi:hypothetical protein